MNMENVKRGAGLYEGKAKMVYEVNEILSAFFLSRGIRLIDFKLEFGRTIPDAGPGRLILADEISPDTCRFWDAKTGEKLDRVLFRGIGGSLWLIPHFYPGKI